MVRRTCAAIALLVLFSGFLTPALAGETKKSSTREILLRSIAPWWEEFLQFLKNGSGIDPFGVPAPSDARTEPQGETQGDNGSSIDPFGGT